MYFWWKAGRSCVTSLSIPKDRQSARIALVEQHIRLEDLHDLDGVLATFGDAAQYDDEPWDEHFKGRDESANFTSN